MKKPKSVEPISITTRCQFAAERGWLISGEHTKEAAALLEAKGLSLVGADGKVVKKVTIDASDTMASGEPFLDVISKATVRLDLQSSLHFCKINVELASDPVTKEYVSAICTLTDKETK